MSTHRTSTLPSPPTTGSPTGRRRGLTQWAALTVLTLGLLVPTAGPADARHRDGLLVEGRILYAVQNQLNRVAVIGLDRTGSSGRVLTTLTDPDFDVPTTIASYGQGLWLPNARFSTPPTPTTAYTAVRIPRP